MVEACLESDGQSYIHKWWLDLSTSRYLIPWAHLHLLMLCVGSPISEERSDKGTNFLGATDYLQIDTISGWKRTPWRIFFTIQEQNGSSIHHIRLTSEELGKEWSVSYAKVLTQSLWSPVIGTLHILCTLMAVVTTIVNSRPLTPVSLDPDSQFFWHETLNWHRNSHLIPIS